LTENERIREIRKAKNLTLERFGAMIGVQKSAISKIERGENAVSDQVRLSICRAFNVSEDWIRTGKGEMFLNDEDTLIAKVADKYHLDSLDLEAFKLYVRLSESDRKVLMSFSFSLAEKILEKPALYRECKRVRGELPKLSQADIEAEVTAYRNELELLAKVQADEVKSTVKQSTNSNSIKAAKRKAPDEMTREDIIAELERQLDEEEETRNTSPVFGPGSSGTATA